MNKNFINNKLKLLKKDNQNLFSGLAEPLAKMVENGEVSKVVKIPSDGNWFNLSFDAVEVAKNRLVISAERNRDGLQPSGMYQACFE